MIPGIESHDGRSRLGGSGRRFLYTLVLLASVLAAAIGATARADPPDAATILRRAEKIRSPQIDYAVEFVLDVVDPDSSWKERSARYTLIAHGKDYSLVLMREPRAFHPGTLLIARGLYWLLLPRSKRSFQLAPRHVLNGDVSNGDLARGNLIAHYRPVLLGEDRVEREDCWRLELLRTNNLGMYSKIRAWITKDFRPWRFEYFGDTGLLLKVADYRDYRETALGLRSMRIDVQNRRRPGEHTTLTFLNLRRFDSSGINFDRTTLLAFRNAALAAFDATGEQASAEEIVARLRDAKAASAVGAEAATDADAGRARDRRR